MKMVYPLSEEEWDAPQTVLMATTVLMDSVINAHQCAQDVLVGTDVQLVPLFLYWEKENARLISALRMNTSIIEDVVPYAPLTVLLVPGTQITALAALMNLKLSMADVSELSLVNNHQQLVLKANISIVI